MFSFSIVGVDSYSQRPYDSDAIGSRILEIDEACQKGVLENCQRKFWNFEFSNKNVLDL